MDRFNRKLQILNQFVMALSELSYCKRAKCAAIVVPIDFSGITAIGYNGPPSGIDNASCTGEEGQCGCCHAEANALIKLVDTRRAYLLCTTAPCVYCAGLILNKKTIRAVFYDLTYRDTRGLELLRKRIQCEPFQTAANL